MLYRVPATGNVTIIKEVKRQGGSPFTSSGVILGRDPNAFSSFFTFLLKPQFMFSSKVYVGNERETK